MNNPAILPEKLPAGDAPLAIVSVQPQCNACGRCQAPRGETPSSRSGCRAAGTGRNPYLLNLRLDPAQAEFVAKRFEEILAQNRFLPNRDAREMMQLAAAPLRQVLSASEQERLLRYGMGRGEPVLMIEGLPKQAMMPATPVHGYCADNTTAFSDLLLLGLYELAGLEPMAYAFENDGQLFRNVVPNPDARGQKSSHGFDAELAWHTDNQCGIWEHPALQAMPAQRSPIPRFLSFIGMRNRDGRGQPVPTRVLPLQPVLQLLSPASLAQLAMPDYQLNPAKSNDTTPMVGVPLIAECEGEFFVRFSSDAGQVLGLTADAQAAIQEMKAALNAVKDSQVIEANVEPGRLLVFDNYRVAHMRSPFDPGSDWAAARWLRRMYGCSALRHGNMVDPKHCPNLWA